MLRGIGTTTRLTTLALTLSTLPVLSVNAGIVVHGALGGTIYG